VSVLGEQHAHVLQELRLPSAERFARLDMQVESGAAFVAGALARLTVQLDTEIEAGDHALTLLRVLELQRDTEQLPLIFFGSGAHRLAR
jgi:flavin reductase (DIM6/NTAB) family NADH-FMN oxidoreductase RutF